MNKFTKKLNRSNKFIRIICFLIAIGMILSVVASGMLMFF